MKLHWVLMMASVGALSATVAFAQQSSWQALDRLQNDLQLTPSQQSAWDAFAKAYSPDPEEIAKQQRSEASMSTLNGPQRVDLAIELAKSDLAELQHRGDALKAFYATLSPEQQKKFDRDTLPPDIGR
jgi:hypothetical protein